MSYRKSMTVEALIVKLLAYPMGKSVSEDYFPELGLDEDETRQTFVVLEGGQLL